MKKNLKFLMLGLLLFSTFTLASTGSTSAAGFNQFITYLTSFFRMIKFVGVIIAIIYFIVKIIEFLANPQWDQLMKTIISFAIIVGGIFGAEAIVKAVGGTTIKNSTKKVRVINFETKNILGERYERK